jgi:hypothetical protein
MFSGLYFIVYGRAKAHWTETRQESHGSGENRRTTTRTVHFEGKEVYLNTKTYLFGGPSSSAVEMASGTYKYDFACPLPMLIPASFEGRHGHIRYNVEAVLDIPWRFDKEFKLQFTLARQDDLNEFPDLKIPVRGEEVKRFCCLFCESQPLMVTVTLPQSGYTPGLNIHVTVNYDNKSDVQVDRTKINLKRIIRFNR